MKVFARTNGEHSQKREEFGQIRSTKNTKTFRKSTGTGNSDEKVVAEEKSPVERIELPLPIPGNETILEGIFGSNSLNLNP